MRSREEIQEEISLSGAEENGGDTVALLQLEILLDIRDTTISYESLWGIYCPQHYGSWYQDNHGGILYFPSKEVAEAFIEKQHVFSGQHLWEPCEFGKQKYFDPYNSKESVEICPVRIQPYFTEGL